MGKIALFGATGAAGRSLAHALRARKTPYRVVGRNLAALEAAFGEDPLAEIVTWKPDDAESVREACRGVDTIIYLVGVAYDQFALHPVLMRQTLEGAIAEGVQRVVLLGTVYPYGVPQTPRVAETHPREPHTFKGQMRKEQEDILLEAHAEGKIQGTILRLPDFYGPGVEKSILNSLFLAAVQGGQANMLGPIETPHQFCYVPDIGPVVLALTETPGAYGHAWNYAGSGEMTQKEIATRAFKLRGRKPRVRAPGKTMLGLLGMFNPAVKEMQEMQYLFTTPVMLDESALQELLGVVPRTKFEQGINATFNYYRTLAAPRSSAPVIE
jgi:nucleoside-diphosphate-sugar epimerase